jgi:tRNA1Val (adenine37-N6)-methyltransferase
MSKPYFQFKQFTVYHDRCAMKVGTDAVLLGAWASPKGAQKVLDIGAGTGVISLMMAQRFPEAQVVGVELDQAAYEQACENASRSPWETRISLVNEDVKTLWTSPESQAKWAHSFDAIVSNPPYFSRAMGCPTENRHMARHDDSLSFGELLTAVERLLSAEGEFSVVIPAEAAPEMIGIAAQHRLFLVRKTWVQTTPRVAPKRCLLAFRFTLPEGNRVEEETLVVQTAPMEYTAAYKALTGAFYLKM